ncbi:uncharacterized protein LOC121367141, partial [Gigantopelta aegis]|uniref:uncharacterized protein LOC121367141 n=1 Tax=Gigantopelta aegis TaxID=1735272 RepID=UPI001B888053
MRMEKKTVDELAQEVVKLNETSYTDPPDQYQIWIDGRSDMFVVLPPSKLTKHGYLLIPEPEGAKDSFWKMVTENDSYTIITLSAESGGGLIPQTSQTLTHGKTTITALRQTSIIHEITEKTLQVDTK